MHRLLMHRALLQRLLGRYVVGLESRNLSLRVWSGKVVLESFMPFVIDLLGV